MLNIGIDWANCKHDLVLKDDSRKILKHVCVKHSAQGLLEIQALALQLESSPSQVRILMERHDGALSSWLVQQGYQVYSINPKSARSLRETYRASGAKDDKSDALILAETLQTSPSWLRKLAPKDPLLEEMESWLRLRTEIVSQKASACQQLRAVLDQWSPELSAVLKDFDRLWQRKLLGEFALQMDLAEANMRHLKAVCGKLRLRQTSFEAVLGVKAALAIIVPEGRREPLRMRTRILLETIERHLEHIKEIDAKLESVVEKHPRKDIFTSLPAKGPFVTSGAMVLFSRDCEDPNIDLACLCGASPVTKRSGKSCWTGRRKAFDRALSSAMTYFALNTMKAGGWAKEYYDSKRREGMHHYAALRCLVVRWIRIISAMLRTGRHYDENLHQQNRLLHKRKAA